jgi:hypothetical protein
VLPRCGDSSAEREFPSDKVYRRDDRGIAGSGLPPLGQVVRRLSRTFSSPVSAPISPLKPVKTAVVSAIIVVGVQPPDPGGTQPDGGSAVALGCWLCGRPEREFLGTLREKYSDRGDGYGAGGGGGAPGTGGLNVGYPAHLGGAG